MLRQHLHAPLAPCHPSPVPLRAVAARVTSTPATAHLRAVKIHRKASLTTRAGFPAATAAASAACLSHRQSFSGVLPYPPPAVKIHRNFKEALTIRTGFAAEAIHGGQLLGVRAQDFIVFYDWATGRVSGWVWLGV